MSIARRSDGRIIVKYKDARGKWQQRSFRDEAEARRFDGEAAYDDVDNERPTVLECVLAFLDNTTHSTRTLQQNHEKQFTNRHLTFSCTKMHQTIWCSHTNPQGEQKGCPQSGHPFRFYR